MKRNRIAGLALALTLVATSAWAQAGTHQITYTGHTSANYGGVYIGPYFASSPDLGNFNVYCVDYFHYLTGSGQTWTADFTAVSDVSGLATRTRWGEYLTGIGDAAAGAKAQVRYQRASWLASQFASQPTSQWPGIHGNMWAATLPPGKTNVWTSWPYYSTWMANLDAAEKGGYQGMDWQYWFVVTDVSGSGFDRGTQEFVTYVTPEPGTILLLASGLVAVLGAAVVTRRVV